MIYMVEVNIDADIILRVDKERKYISTMKILIPFFLSIQLRFLNNRLHTRTPHITDE